MPKFQKTPGGVLHIRPDETPEQARQRVTAAYQAAKAANPKLTQGQFAVKALPTIAARYDEAKSPAERKRIEQSGARYLRLVQEGKRTGRLNVERAFEYLGGGSSDLYQVIVYDAYGNAHSFNITALGGRSTLDIPILEQRLRENPLLLGRKYEEFAKRYKVSDIDLANLTVRRVLSHRKPSERIIL